MNNVLSFIWKYHVLFVFVGLQLLAYMLTVGKSNVHHSSYFSSSHLLVGGVYDISSDVTGYFGLRKENLRLTEENAQLRNALYRLNGTSEITAKVDSGQRVKYDFLEAEVINNSVKRRNNYLTLNKGLLDGVEPEMGVMGPLGVVGIVKDVSKRYASVISVLHNRSSVSVRIENTGYFGPVSWNGMDSRVVQLNDIPSHVKLEVGQVLITSGHSAMFPAGLRLGTIKDFNISAGDNFYSINVNLSEDMTALRSVYVISNLERLQQLILEEHNGI